MQTQIKRGEMFFHSLWDSSTFESEGIPFRKVSNGVSINLLTGKDAILSLHTVCHPLPERILYKKHNITWLK